MTQPPIIGPSARARSVTDKLIDSVLTVMVSELQGGASRDQVTDLAGLELNEPRVDLARMRLLAACTLSRLAVLHHEIKQLADQQDAIAEKYIGESRNAVRLVSAELRKLVDP